MELEQARVGRDVELTLGFPSIMLIFLGLVLLCGLCFGLGYRAGHSEPQANSASLPSASGGQAAQADNSATKPSGNTLAASTAAQPQAAANPQPVDGANSALATAENPAAGAPNQSPQVKSALGNIAGQVQTGPPPTAAVAPAMETPSSHLPPTSSALMVQVAAVSQPEDSDVLVGALRRRGYAVTAHREPLDGLIHVKVGPFKTREEAENWRQRLLNDGYNAIVQQ